MSELTNIKGQANFDTEVINSTTPVLVDFWAPWCGPCIMMTPVLEEIAKEHGDKIKIVKVDTDEAENQQLAFDYQIRSIPSMKVFKSGELVKEISGYKPKEVLLQELQEFLD